MSTDISLDTFLSNTFGADTSTQDILDAFEFLDDWEDRYAYIIDLGKNLPAFPESEKTEENLVRGCQSQVWLIHKYDDASQTLHLLIDSDAIIVKGLAAVVMAALNRQSPKHIQEMDVEAVFADMDLLRHLSPTRGNGLRAMLERIKLIAENYA